MSVLLEILFATLGALAITALFACWRQLPSMVSTLRHALRRPEGVEEIRLTLYEHMLAPTRPMASVVRHMRRPKPIRHRLTGRTPRRAIA